MKQTVRGNIMKKEKKKNLRELPSGNWRYRKMVDGHRVSIVFDHEPTEKEITKAVTKELAAAGERVPKSSFGKYAERYIEMKKPVLSPSTVRSYEAIRRALSDTLKKTDINDITQAMIQTEISAYAKEHSAKTVSNFHGFISAVLRMYRPGFHLVTTLPQKVRFDAVTPSEEDIKRIMEHAKGTVYSVPIQLGILGLRRSEACALSIEDLSGNELSITKAKVYASDGSWIIKKLTKTTEGKRTIFIPDALVDEIHESGFYEHNPNIIVRYLHRTQDELGIPRFRFHDLRAFYCSYSHSNGVPEAVIMKSGGWASPYVMKKVYRRALEDDVEKYQKQIVNKLF